MSKVSPKTIPYSPGHKMDLPVHLIGHRGDDELVHQRRPVEEVVYRDVLFHRREMVKVVRGLEPGYHR